MPVAFELCILGVNSALPTFGRHPTCQVLKYDNLQFLIDCGEGSLKQIKKYKYKISKVSHILISHLHGDHSFGLPAILTSESLNNRSLPLTIHGPIGIKEFCQTIIRLSGSYISYPLTINEYDANQQSTIHIDKRLSITTVPLKHRIACQGYLFKETAKSYILDADKIKLFELNYDEIAQIQSGIGIIRGNDNISAQEVCSKIMHPRGYAYISDTIYDEEIIPFLTGVSTLYHETTYLDDLLDLAVSRMHSTLGQAISIAERVSSINQLITGHYSSRYKDISIFEKIGNQTSEKVTLGQEGVKYFI